MDLITDAKDERLCAKCGLPIHRGDSVRHGYGGPSHVDHRCVELLQLQVRAALRDELYEATDACNGLHDMVRDLEKENAAPRAEVARLREAVEWALKELECVVFLGGEYAKSDIHNTAHLFMAELRRRAALKEGT